MIERLKHGVAYAVLIFGCGVGLSSHIRPNLTPSMPEGIWGVTSAAYAAERGNAVVACLPYPASSLGRWRGYLGHGHCPGDVEAVLKTVVAVPGDTVTVAAAGISVNGAMIPNTAALPVDSQGRKLDAVRPGTYEVKPGTVWLVTNHDRRSYDSRYFGAVPIESIRNRAVSLLTF